MSWNEDKDIHLMREMISIELFSHKSGSRERGEKRQNIATNLNGMEGFNVTNRSVRDFTIIMKKFKANNNKEVASTGIGGHELTEYEVLLEELTMICKESEQTKRKGDDQESTSSSRKSRRTSSDTIEFLKHKLEAENERQREKMDLQRAQQTQFSNVLQQMQQQNAQMQQQNTMALMQQQQEQF